MWIFLFFLLIVIGLIGKFIGLIGRFTEYIGLWELGAPKVARASREPMKTSTMILILMAAWVVMVVSIFMVSFISSFIGWVMQ